MTYEQRLRALGRLIDQQEMQDLCILEVEGGVVVSGVGRAHTHEGVPVLGPKSLEFADSVIESAAAHDATSDGTADRG